MYALRLHHHPITPLHGHLPQSSPTALPRCSSSPFPLPAASAARNRRTPSFTPRSAAAGQTPNPNPQNEPKPKGGFWTNWMPDSAEMRARVAKLGLAAVLAYGLFDAVTYTAFFVLAFLGYEKSTGKNPAANLQALLGIVILMWTGNNVTRPFRVAGAAALAPAIDKGLKSIQEKLNLPSLIYAFALVVGTVAAICSTIVGFLILSKWGK